MAKNRNFTEIEKDKIIADYLTGNFTCPKLGKVYNVSKTTIVRILKSRNVKILNDKSEINRKYFFVNRNFFNVIDCEEKAYFLGLMFADGCNQTSSFSISLQEKDKEILEKFNLCLGSNRPLQLIKLNDKNPLWQDSYRLTITGQEICQSLSDLGCTPAKSLTLQFPTAIPKNLIRHFVRGYMDGDGSFCLYPNKKTNYFSYGASLVSTLEFCDSLKEIIQNELNINSHIGRRKGSTTNTRTLTVNGMKTCHKFLNWVYEDCSFFLKRKMDKYQKNKLFLEENYFQSH